MFVVLSEIDCLSWLQIHGIFPDEFFTDMDLFRNKMIVYSDVDVVVLFAGSCNFRKRLVCELVTQLRERLGKGIRSVTVYSDCVLPSLNEYYKYTERPQVGCLHNKYKKVGGEEDLWEDFEGLPKHKAKKFLARGKEEHRKPTEEELKDDELIKVIKIPNLQAMKGAR